MRGAPECETPKAGDTLHAVTDLFRDGNATERGMVNTCSRQRRCAMCNVTRPSCCAKPRPLIDAGGQKNPLSHRVMAVLPKGTSQGPLCG